MNGNNQTQAARANWTALDVGNLGTNTPTNQSTNATWEVRKAGGIIATSEATNGWALFFDGVTLWVKPPANATLSTDYEARYATGSNPGNPGPTAPVTTPTPGSGS